ncbi:hypothetical protein CV102_16920 [Natronococcus pandeyae]|uniref:DUF4870 domain-containing protein n=1 Tax=Natronococcus pandeyae TaxID=2055836 RepID=A0A8J8Q1T0_9EURY|nr:DUF4870 domain-containing protein [Natronococcus pandeyae]TYL37309.1 hypothetical protein CV102_16920 [Natronococcus pandeyae]
MVTEDTNVDTELATEQSQTETGAPETGPADTDSEIVGGLDKNVAGALAYLFGFVTGLIFYLVEDDNEFVRFHAAQSMIVFGGLIAFSFGVTFLQIFLEMIPVVGWMMSLGLALLSLLILPIGFVLWLVLLIKAYRGQRYGLPVVGNIAEGWV